MSFKELRSGAIVLLLINTTSPVCYLHLLWLLSIEDLVNGQLQATAVNNDRDGENRRVKTVTLGHLLFLYIQYQLTKFCQQLKNDGGVKIPI